MNQTSPKWAPSLNEANTGLNTASSSALSQGLSTQEAELQRQKSGPNRLRAHQERSAVRQYLAHFKNPLVLILLIASLVSALSGEVTNFVIISCIVLLSVTLDFVQEYRANAAAARLRNSVSLRCTVLRDQQPQDLPVAELVPGDVVLLTPGCLVPADGEVLSARDFFVNQALLTGEAYPVEKRPALAATASSDSQGDLNKVFMGTSVISGSAHMRVVNIGLATELGAISDSVSREAAPSAFEVGTRRFGMMIMRLTILLVMFVLLVNLLSHKPWLDSFLFAVALAVGLTPELLPMVVSITLSRGSIKMAAQGMIVKRQSAIQDLGSMDVLCTDKTGTLTEAKIRLERHVNPQGDASPWVLQVAYLNSYFESGIKSPLDDAILEHDTIDVSSWNKIDEVPFDFERRRVSVLLDQGQTRWLMVKGAPEDILSLCTHFSDHSAQSTKPLDADALKKVRNTYESLEAEGFRVLGIAWRRVPLDHPHAVVNDESELILAGFSAFLDPPKQSASLALHSLQSLNVAIKIVTGDSDLVTKHVCRELKIPVTGVLTGREIAEMDDSALQARVESITLFCRVNPAQKNRVIQALKARGHVVGYLGDGANDAPSLHSADVGISVDSAVDVAKASADMIMLRQDLSVLHEAVAQGRRTFANIMKYIMMGTSSNFGNMFSMAGAAVFLPFLPMLPTQILLNNILYDLSEVPIPFDSVDSQEIVQPRVMDITTIRNFMLTIGPISSVFDFLTFYVMLKIFEAQEKMFQTAWFVESLCTQVLVIFVIRTRGSLLTSKPHISLTLTSLLIVGIALALPLSIAGQYFNFTPLPMSFYAVLAVMVISYLTLVECIKRKFFS